MQTFSVNSSKWSLNLCSFYWLKIHFTFQMSINYQDSRVGGHLEGKLGSSSSIYLIKSISRTCEHCQIIFMNVCMCAFVVFWIVMKKPFQRNQWKTPAQELHSASITFKMWVYKAIDSHSSIPGLISNEYFNYVIHTDNRTDHQIVYRVLENTTDHIQSIRPLSASSVAQYCKARIPDETPAAPHATAQHSDQSTSSFAQVRSVALSTIIYRAG